MFLMPWEKKKGFRIEQGRWRHKDFGDFGKGNFCGKWKPNCSLLKNGDEVEYLRKI